MTALASFSEGDTVNLVSKAALMSPIASLGHITSSIASAASFLFVDEVKCIPSHNFVSCNSKIETQITEAWIFYNFLK